MVDNHLGIIALGDANAYLLSTAEENLGVIAARSTAGRNRCFLTIRTD